VIELLGSSPALFVGGCALLGLALGSFLNVVIYRLPVMLERAWHEQCAELTGAAGARTLPSGKPRRFDLIVPRSACPACQAPIAARHNIPLLSFLLLRGRCAHCGEPISLRYPLVEALTAVLCAAVAWRFGFTWPALAALALSCFLIALAFIDVDHQLLPDALTLPLLWLGLLVSLWGPVRTASIPLDLRSSVLGAMAGYASLWGVYHLFRLLTGKEGMGYGDFKLCAALGAWLGWQMLLPILLLASVTGAVVGLIVLTLRGESRTTPIPFGPFLAAAGRVMLMFGPQLTSGYFAFPMSRP